MHEHGSTLGRLRGDLFGGLTAGVVALPLALAFGVASGAGAAAGLYGAVVLGFVAALLGGTRMQISGPTGPMTVVFASALVVVGGDVGVAMAAVLIGGLVVFLIGTLLCAVASDLATMLVGRAVQAIGAVVKAT